MKIVSKNLVIYGFLLIVLTLVFRYTLSWVLENEMFKLPWVVGIIYGAIIFIIAWIFGKRDKLSLPLFDIGFRMHFVTYLICNVIGELWFVFGYNSHHEHISVIHITAMAWGLGLLIHFISYIMARKDSIKGLKKSEIFD